MKLLLCARHLHTVSLNHVQSPPKLEKSASLVLQMNVGLMGRKEQSERLSPFPLTLIPAFPLRHCAGSHESGAQRRRQMERWGPWGRGWWSQGPRATDSTLMGTQEWLVASMFVLGQKQAETGQPAESQGRASTTSRSSEIKQRVSLSTCLC